MDAVLPDGTTVPAVYVKLRNHLNRVGQGIGSHPLPNSYQMIQYLWSEEDAQHEIEMPINKHFDANEYAVLSGRPVEEAKGILDDLAMRGMIMRAHRSGHDTYHLLPYINGFWEFNELRAYFENGGDCDGKGECPEAYAAAAEFDMQGITSGKDRGGSSPIPLFHTYPVSKDVCEDGVMAPHFDWEAIIRSNEQITVSPCQCRLMWKSLDVPMCHGDCCGNLSSYKASGGQTQANANMSAYVLKYFKDKCIKCGACVNWCPMEAISFGEDGLCLHNNACVRCGQCVTVCPADARIPFAGGTGIFLCYGRGRVSEYRVG